MSYSFSDRIKELALNSHVCLTSSQVCQLASYVALLARWNAAINLTSLNLEAPDDDALRRLVIEPIGGAQFIASTDVRFMDFGSGGGSPALPLRIVCPWLQLVMVEARHRKCAFLREAVRTLELTKVVVEPRRFESLPDAYTGWAELVSFRAVRADESFWSVVRRVSRVPSRLLWFGGVEDAVHPDWALRSRGDDVLHLVRSESGST